MLVLAKSGPTAEISSNITQNYFLEPYPLISKRLFLRTILGETLLFLMSYKIVVFNLEHVSFDV